MASGLHPEPLPVLLTRLKPAESTTRPACRFEQGHVVEEVGPKNMVILRVLDSEHEPTCLVVLAGQRLEAHLCDQVRCPCVLDQAARKMKPGAEVKALGQDVGWSRGRGIRLDRPGTENRGEPLRKHSDRIMVKGPDPFHRPSASIPLAQRLVVQVASGRTVFPSVGAIRE